MELFPVQQIVFKLIEGIPLDDTTKFNVTRMYLDETGQHLCPVFELRTERSYVNGLIREGRCVIPDEFSNPEWREQNVKTVCLVTGRQAGKSVIISEMAATDLGRRVVSHKGTDMLGLLTVSRNHDQARLLLREMLDAVFRRPELAARLANETQNHYQFQTDDDIARTGSWKGSRRRASATVALWAKSSMSRGLFKGFQLGFVCIEEADHLWANQADEAWRAKDSCLQHTAGTAMAVGSPGVKGWMRKLFGQPHVLSIRIPTWEMNPVIPHKFFDDAYKNDPDTFWAEFGACWLEGVQTLRPVGAGSPSIHGNVRPPVVDSRVGTGMNLNEIGRQHCAWLDKNYDGISALTHALALTEEAGEVARAILKTHHGIRSHDRGNVADELADVIIVASGLAEWLGINIEEAVTAKAARRDLKNYRMRQETG